MAWRIAVVLDKELNLDSLRVLAGQMPIWALDIPARKAALAQINEEFEPFWAPEPAFTVFTPAKPDDLPGSLFDLVPGLLEHHPSLSGLSVFGVETSPKLQDGLAKLGFQSVPDPDSIYPDRLRFAKPLSRTSPVRRISLDAGGWRSRDDFYSAFFDAVGAPEWHGRNFNALNDSIGQGSINKIEVPYRIVIQNLDRANAEIEILIRDFGQLIVYLQNDGCPVDLIVD